MTAPNLARAALREAMEVFDAGREALFAKRDAAIRQAALQLSRSEVIQTTGLSDETIRKITKGHPVSWRRQVTVRRLASGGQ